MDFNSKNSIKENGFYGFKTVQELWENHSVIPKKKGVYLVINPTFEQTEFINPGVGGFFKGKDPNVSFDELSKNHVENSQVVYIGKAGSLTGNATLKSRLWQFLRFGQTQDVGHWGGRLIWQLKNHPNLVFAWKDTPQTDPRSVEKELIQLFINQFGNLPFANLRR